MKLDKLEEKIIYHLMMRSDPIPASQLADLCNVSVNTIRSRLPDLNDRIAGDNLKIVMKRSVGCSLVKTGETEKQTDKSISYNINRSRYVTSQLRCDFIIRRLLCAPSYVKVNELCDTLFYSYSELHRDIIKANKWLIPFHLSIVTRRNRGLCIEGNEFHKRICMIFQHKRFRYLDDEQKNNEPWFASIFSKATSPLYFQKRISAILKDYPEYAFSHINIPKIINMIFIMINRREFAARMDFPADAAAEVHESPSYKISRALISSSGTIVNYEPSEKEIISLAVMIESYRSIRSSEDIASASCFPLLFNYSSHVLNRIREIFAPHSQLVPESEIYTFTCSLYSIRMMMRFGLPLDSELLFPLQRTDVTSQDYAMAFHEILKEEFGAEIPPHLVRLTTYFFRNLQSSFYSYETDYSVLIYSIYGIEYTNYVSRALSPMYSNSLKPFKVIEHIPLPDPDKREKYDLLITDAYEKNLQDTGMKDLARYHIWLPLINHPQRIPELDTWLCERQIELICSVSENRILHTSCRDEKDVFNTLYRNLNGEISFSEEEFVTHCKAREAVLPSLRENRIAYITFDMPSKDADVLEILINKKAIPWNDSKVQFFVFYNFTYEDSRVFNAVTVFLRLFVRQTPANLISLVSQNEKDIISFIMTTDEAQ